MQCGLLKDLLSLTLCGKPTEAFRHAIHVERLFAERGFSGSGCTGEPSEVQIDSGSEVEIRSNVCIMCNLKVGGFYDVMVCTDEGRGVNTLRA